MKHNDRNYLFQYLDVKDQHTNEQIGYLGDISDEGLMFVTNSPSSVNAILEIYINYEKENAETEKLKLKIQVRWIKPNVNPEMYCVGCLILEMDQKSKVLLKNIAESMSFDQDLEIKRVND